MEVIQINTSRLIKVGRDAQEQFFTVDMSGGVFYLHNRGRNGQTRKVLDVNGYQGFKFKGNLYQTETKTINVSSKR